MGETIIHTDLGPILLKGTAKGLVSLQFTDHQSPSRHSSVIPSFLEEAKDQLEDYFSGNRKNFDLELSFQGTPFQESVWKRLLEIPWGQRITYLDLAKGLGNPTAIRAVAAAVGKNPLLVVVPCHRVIGSNGSLTGYAAGLQRKQWLLEHESQTGQQRLF